MINNVYLHFQTEKYLEEPRNVIRHNNHNLVLDTSQKFLHTPDIII